MQFLKGMRRLERELCFIGMLLVLAIAFMTSADVFGRYVLARPIPGVPEVSAMIFTVGIFLSLAYTQAERGNVRVEALLKVLPRRVVNVTEFIALLLVVLIVALLTWSTAQAAIRSIMILEVKFGAVPVPLWPAKLFFPIGTFLLCVRLIVDAVSHVRSLRKEKKDNDCASQR